jgi:hypothetical protein
MQTERNKTSSPGVSRAIEEATSAGPDDLRLRRHGSPGAPSARAGYKGPAEKLRAGKAAEGGHLIY